jgi:hypothetical protein
MEKVTRKSNPSLVVKSNQLINSRFTLTVTEMRLFLLMVAQVERDDRDFKPYRIKIRDFADAIGSNFKDYYKTAEQSSRQLLSRVMEIPTANGNLLQVSFLSSAEYFRGEGIIELSFDPKLKPYLLELKDRFTSYDIRNVLRLQSSHSMRIYELLKQFEPIGRRTFDVEELKKTLCIEQQYKKYNDFKRYVILQAQKELSQHCDITFDFEEIKQSKKIISICFTIIQQEKSHPAMAILRDAPVSAPPPYSDLVQALCELGIPEDQAMRYSKAKDPVFLREKIDQVKQRFEEGKIKSPTAYLVALIEHDAQTTFPVADKASQGPRPRFRPGMGKAAKSPQQGFQSPAQTRQLLETLEREFDQERTQQLKVLVKQASEKDWKAFERYVATVPYLKGKFFENGVFQRQHADALHWLGIYLAEGHLPDRDAAFVQWAARRGVVLEKAGTEEGQYVLVSS